jgi:Cdc6-like AAA superfamily ATPase
MSYFSHREPTSRPSHDPKGFLEESDAAYDKKVKNRGGKDRRNLPNSPIVLLSGPSGSGKTTTAMNIADALEAARRRHALRRHGRLLQHCDAGDRGPARRRARWTWRARTAWISTC